MPEIGYEVEEPERLAVRALLPQRPDGSWAGLQSAIIAPRQNIKTASMIACAIHDLFVQDLDVVWTAHEFKTSADAFKDFQAIIEGSDELSSSVLKVRTANGSEGFELRSGVSLRIVARSGRSGRGFSKVPRLYLDEGLFLDAKMLGAITPTMAAIPDAHLVVGSSPGILSSEQLRGIRDRGRAGTDQDLGYVEWTSERILTAEELALPRAKRPRVRPQCLRVDCSHAPGSDGCALDNEELWWRANPALQRRIAVDFLRQQRKVLKDAIPEFMREHMAWWEDPPTIEESSQFDMAKWSERLDPASIIPVGARVVFTVDTSWDRQTSWVSIAGLNAAGVPHGEVIETGYGQDWVVPWLKERVAAWKTAAIGLQGGNAPSSSLLAPLRKEFGDKLVVEFTGVDMTRACGAFFDAVDKGPLAHLDQEQVDDAMRQAAPRLLGDGWVLDRKESPIDIANLVSLVEALYLLQTAPEPPQESFIPRRLR